MRGGPFQFDQPTDLEGSVEQIVEDFLEGQKGEPDGIASLDSDGRIPASQLPAKVMEYQGTWDADTNSPTLTDTEGSIGDVYLVTTPGTVDLGSGDIDFEFGDWAILNNALVWEKVAHSGMVASVNGQTGAVTLDYSDVGAAAAVHTHVSTDITDFDEAVQDTVGGMVSDNTEMDWTYDDAVGSLVVSLKTGSVTPSKLAASAQYVLFGRSSSGSGQGQEIATSADVFMMLQAANNAAILAAIGAGTYSLTNNSLSAARLAASQTAILFGRYSSGSGGGEEITIGTGLSLSAGGVLSSTGSYDDEHAQDAVGAMIANSARVSLTYTDATPSLVADLVADSVTVGYLHSSATARLFGRTTAAAGAGEEISLGAGLAFSGSTLTSTITQYTDEMAQDAIGAALTDTTEVDFTYDDTANTITADLKANSVVVGKLHASATARLFGRTTAAAGAGEEIALGAGLSFSAGTLVSTITQYTDEMAQDAIGALFIDSNELDFTYDDTGNSMTADLKNNSVVAARLKATAQYVLFGRSSSGAGVGQEVATSADVFSMLGAANNAAIRAAIGAGSYTPSANSLPVADLVNATQRAVLAASAAGAWAETALSADVYSLFGYANNAAILTGIGAASLLTNTFVGTQTINQSTLAHEIIFNPGSGGVGISTANYQASTASQSIGVRKARGAASNTPAAAATNDPLGFFKFQGYGASAFQDGAAITATVIAATPSNTDMQSELSLQTTPAGSVTLADRVKLRLGMFGVSTTGGDKGQDTLNFTTLYEAGTSLASKYYQAAANTLPLADLSNSASRAIIAASAAGAWAERTVSADIYSLFGLSNYAAVATAIGAVSVNVSNTFTASQSIQLAGTAAFDVVSDSNAIIREQRYSADSSDPTLEFYKGRGSASSPAAVVQNDFLGMIRWRGQGSAIQQAAYLRAQVIAATPSNTDMQTELGFYTSGAGSVSPTQRFKIGTGVYSPSATGGDKGADTCNFSTVYQAGNKVVDTGGGTFTFASALALTLSDTTLTINGVSSSVIVLQGITTNNASIRFRNGNGEKGRITATDATGMFGSIDSGATFAWILDPSNRFKHIAEVQLGAFTLATYPTALDAGSLIRITDAGGMGASNATGTIPAISTGASQSWQRPTSFGGYTTVGDASLSWNNVNSGETVEFNTILTANRSITLANAPVAGARMRVIRTGGGAFTLTVNDATPTALIVFPINSTGWVEFIFNGTGWVAMPGMLHMEGFYTPTLTNIANLDASTASICWYQRNGQMIMVSGKVTMDPTTASTLTRLGVSLPIASNIANDYDVGGCANATSIGGASQMAVIGDATNDRAEIRTIVLNTTNQPYSFNFQYVKL